MKNKINVKLILKSIFVIIFFYFYSYIFLAPFTLLHINLSKLSMLYKVFILFFMDILLMTILWLIYKKDLKREFEIFKQNWKEYVFKNIKYWILGLVLMSVSNLIINAITAKEIANNEAYVREMISASPIYGIFSACIVAPFTEEIVFRKTFKDILKNKYVLIVTCGLVFGLVHVIGTFTSYTDFLYVIPYGIFGSIFAYLYYKTDTVFTSMSIHFIHNTLLLIIYITTVFFHVGG